MMRFSEGFATEALGGSMGRCDAEPGARGGASGSNRLLNNLRGTAGALGLLVLGAAALAAPVLLRSATVTAPSLRAALEMMLSMFALGGAWLLRSQFVSSRRLRDLQLVVATLVLGAIRLAVAALPAALNLSGTAFFAAAQLWGMLFVAAMFAASAVVPAELLIIRRRHA